MSFLYLRPKPNLWVTHIRVHYNGHGRAIGLELYCFIFSSVSPSKTTGRSPATKEPLRALARLDQSDTEAKGNNRILIKSCGGPLMTSDTPQGDTRQYEETHVHQVYQEIASHFSSTRYKPWPIVERFLKDLVPGSIGLDIGCGNGRYLAVNPNVFIVASDRSANLVKIASQHQPHSSLVADNLNLPHQLAFFDFAISIAVVHHLATPQRRIQAVSAILEMLRRSTEAETGGRALIYVWALEQKHSRRGWDEGDDQDVMVPWVMKQGPEEGRTLNRYYHLYRQGELERDIVEAGGVILKAGYEKDNWWAIAAPKPP